MLLITCHYKAMQETPCFASMYQVPLSHLTINNQVFQVDQVIQLINNIYMLIHVNIVFKATSQPANSELYSMKETSEDSTLNFFRKTLN